MLDFEWDNTYKTNVEKIDIQHRYFLEICKELQSAIEADASLLSISDLLEEIVLYATFHFRSEENYMKQVGFADLERHRELHRTLALQLTENTELLKTEALAATDFMKFLLEWLVGHILLEDQKLTRHNPVYAQLKRGYVK